MLISRADSRVAMPLPLPLPVIPPPPSPLPLTPPPSDPPQSSDGDAALHVLRLVVVHRPLVIGRAVDDAARLRDEIGLGHVQA